MTADMTQYTPSAPSRASGPDTPGRESRENRENGRSRESRPIPPTQGLTLFGGAMLVVIGLLDLCYGVMAELHEDQIVSTRDYAFHLSTDTWGWWHVAVGVVLAGFGAAVIAGLRWARVAAIAAVGLAAVGNFLSVPYAPLWALVLLVLDVFVMWSLAAAEPARTPRA